MRIVQLKAVLFSELTEITPVRFDPVSQYVLQTGGSKKVLLTQTQFPSVLGFCVWIQNHGDILGLVLGRHRIRIVTGIEFFQVKLIGGCR